MLAKQIYGYICMYLMLHLTAKVVYFFDTAKYFFTKLKICHTKALWRLPQGEGEKLYILEE